MNNHNHCVCSHTLKYCEHCDIVYCINCNKEWKNNYINTYCNGTVTLCGNYTTSGTGSGDTNLINNCSHK